MTKRNPTRKIKVGSTFIGGGEPVVLQSMCATKTVDVAATAAAAELLRDAGAMLVRIAVDTPSDAEALSEIRQRTTANLSVDLQENWRLAERVAPFVDKIRYNPGHLHHTETEMSWREKVKRIAAIAETNDCALRVGVNCGSLAPNQVSADDPIFISALEHTQYLDSIGFTRYCVSLKSSNAAAVIAVNRRFAAERPDVPLHLGVTEAGMPPEGIMKSRLALETLLGEGIGDTIRVSLTVPNERKTEEIQAGRMILDNVSRGIVLTEKDWQPQRLNIVSCPSCARVQNSAFVELAQRVREATKFASGLPITIAVMGCRVN
ncbi:MAG: flavodoxin-dependent (E)-4-hydroxy-3-methylbut-2-enyl-diphosphate synthase, partial [Planctomycetaceae bacterium]|nr:flavodoxin-dependent (E)-4-hydroxy-3-methylbut-2-enyl-diphosphate synthase [Planctomycetaceae bacterium]